MRHYWVDRIEVVEPGVSGVGYKAIAYSEDFFTDHFPGNPVFPGIYLLEGMAQTAGAIITRSSDWTEFALMVSVDRARFSSFARPGEVVRYEVTMEERTGESAAVRAKATAGERRVAHARFTFRILPTEDMIPAPYRGHWHHALGIMFDVQP
jgi:3-hydroxyacyl-[acyl-carrier-protein] dehydratase